MLVTHSTKAIAVGESKNAGSGGGAAEDQQGFRGRDPDVAAILQLFFKDTHF